MDRKQKVKSDRPPAASAPRVLAGWQRALLWAVWLGFVVVLWNNSQYGALGWTEAGVLAGAIAITVWCSWHRFGKPRIIIREPAQMVGEFASRVSWPWLLFSVFVMLGGVAMTIKVTRDLHYGFTTISGVVVDIIDFFYEWWLEIASRGRHGDVTHTRLYILIVLLPIGLGMLWYNLLPILYRGRAFRVEERGSLQFNRRGDWVATNVRDFASASADGFTITFKDASDKSLLTLPQWRVYSREHDTPVAQHVIAAFFRKHLESNSFHVETRESGRKLETAWIATRTS
jgi:hypothetical protein